MGFAGRRANCCRVPGRDGNFGGGGAGHLLGLDAALGAERPDHDLPGGGGAPAISVTATVSYNITANNNSGSGFCTSPVAVTVTPSIAGGTVSPATCAASVTVPTSGNTTPATCTVSWTAPATPAASYTMTAAATSNSTNGNFNIAASNALTFTRLPPPAVTISGTATVTEGANANLTATLGSASVGNTVVSYSVGGTAVAGTDFTALSGSVTIPNGQTTVTIPVATLDNAIDQDTRTVIVTLTGATNGAVLGAATEATVSIQDNDTAGVTVSGGPLTIAEAAGTGNFTVVLTSEPTAAVTITVTSSGPDAAAVSPATLTFTPANWNSAQTVTATGVDDDVASGGRTVTVSMAAASSDGAYDSIAIADVGVTVMDDDETGIIVAPTTLSLVEGESGSFTVVLTSEPTADVTITVTSTDPGAATVSPASLTFTNANWNSAQAVTVSGIDDGDPRGPNRNATIALTLTGPYPVEPNDVSVTVRNLGAFDETLVQSTFEDVSRAFIGRRMDWIIAAEPQGYRFDRRLTANGVPQFSVSTKGDAGDLGLSYGRTSADSTWYTWAEAQFSVYKDGTGTLDERDGRFGLLSFGTDYLLTPKLAIGLMVQVDSASEKIDGFSDISGTGWLAGPYLSMEVAPDLYFSARAARGHSSNDASIEIDGELYSGGFSTDRRLARAMLYGKMDMGRTKLTPSAELTYMRESQDDYTVSDGVNTTTVDGIDAELWRLSMAVDIETPLRKDAGSMIFFARPQLDWNIDARGTELPERASGSIEVGLRTGADSPWNGEVAIGYDGIGQSDFEGFSARAQLAFRF